MECEEVLVRLWEYLDDELRSEEADGVRSHLKGCPDCYPAASCRRALLQLLARQRDRCSAPPELVTAVLVRLRSF